MALTLTTVITSVRDLLNETTASFFTDAEITRWIGQASLDASTVGKCVEATTTIGMVTSTPSYSLPTDNVEVMHVEWVPTRQGLRRITPSLLGEAGTELEDDQPLRWFEYAAQLWVEPLPSVTAAGETVRVYYSRATQDVTLLPDSYQLLAILYATAMGKAKDKRYAEMAALMQIYNNSLAFRKVELNARVPHADSDLKLPTSTAVMGRQSG